VAISREQSIRDDGDGPSRETRNKPRRESPRKPLRTKIITAAIVCVCAAGGLVVPHIFATTVHGLPAVTAASGRTSALAPASPVPSAAPASAAPVEPPPVAPVTQVLAIGDSIMKGFGLPPAEAWPALLATQQGWHLTTLACNGAGFVAIGSALDCHTNFSGIITGAASLRPDVVLISGSSNDFGQSNAALLHSTVAALAQLRAQFPAAQIIGLSTMWGNTEPPAQLAEVDAQVKQAVEQVGGIWLNIGQALAGRPDLMQADNIHPTAAGQLVLDNTIQAAYTTARQAAEQAVVDTTLTTAHGHL
jgi:acyl-CoA thioesterase-1